MVEIVLLERVERLGQMGDVVRVRPGYARNFLLPKKKALRATKANLAAFEARKAQLIADNLKRKEEAEQVAVKMAGLAIALVRSSGESGHLYGSVTSRDIADEVTAKGFTVNRTQVLIDHPIKTVGVASVRVLLHPEVAIAVSISVAPSLDEANALLRASQPTPAPVEAPAEEAVEAEAEPVAEE